MRWYEMVSGSSNPPESPLRTSRVFGVTLASSYPFENYLLPDSGVPDITFSCISGSQSPPIPKDRESQWTGKIISEHPESLISIYSQGDCHILHFDHVDFIIRPATIVAHLRDGAYRYLVELWLFGKIFSVWLELQGIPTIHSSSVVTNHGAISFLSTSGGGKSALAAALVKAGCPLLTDDILPVRREEDGFFGVPGYPSMRMWPDQAAYFLGCYEGLDLVHPLISKRRVRVGQGGFGTFCNREQPLKVIYVPDRQDPDAELRIEPVTPVDALFELIKNSFTAQVVEALGLQPQRMKFFTDMVMQLPVRRLIYPDGYDSLPEVRNAVLEDVASL